VVLGPTPSVVSQVGPAHVLQPFYVRNTGNAFESVLVTVVDAPRLASLGWNATVQTSTQHVTDVAQLAPGENDTLYVQLNATSRVTLLPGSVTVSATVLNASGSVATSGTLSIPLGTVHPTAPPGTSVVVVTGPSVGSAPSSLPTWVVPLLVFVPALGLVVGVVVYRWWRTRRWRR
jgi:hypothetical protein